MLTVVNAELVRAIREKRLIAFLYKTGRLRTAEPHDYGVRRGVECLLCYQVGGASRSGASHGWKWIVVADVRELQVLERHFPGTRTDTMQEHRDWDTLFARVT